MFLALGDFFLRLMAFALLCFGNDGASTDGARLVVSPLDKSRRDSAMAVRRVIGDVTSTFSCGT